MAEALLRVEGLVKRFGGLVATDNLDLDIRADEVHALIGPNGAGKTTLITQLMGELTPDTGAIRLGDTDLAGLSTADRVRKGLTRTFQIAQLLENYSALDNVALAVQAKAGHSFRFWSDARKDPALRRAAGAHLAHVGLAARADTRVADLSHGERKQLELAVALACNPRVLLLDEPMAGLGIAESAQMIGILKGLKGKIAILLVEHDMDAVFALADRISVLVYGRVIASGDADSIRANPEVRAAYLGEGD
jgi:branched-chain amino acid transport system ATP-binding protein